MIEQFQVVQESTDKLVVSPWNAVIQFKSNKKRLINGGLFVQEGWKVAEVIPLSYISVCIHLQTQTVWAANALHLPHSDGIVQTGRGKPTERKTTCC